MLREYGYYYERFDARDGARALLAAMREHDRSLAAYNAKSRELLRRVDINDPENLARHEALLFALLGP
jgi:hypothetical protein